MSVLEQWLKAWERLLLKGDPHDEFQDVVHRYSEPHRRYHTLKHVEYCLEKLMELPRIAYPEPLVIAIVLHDIVYSVDPAEYSQNEVRSADYAAEMLYRNGAHSDLTSLVQHCIYSTKPANNPLTLEGRYATDVDLAALGEDPHTFDRDAERIRKEFRGIPDADFYPANLSILKSLLNRAHIYHSQVFRARYEARAVANIRRRLARPELQPFLPK